jgi:hypothetical protein
MNWTAPLPIQKAVFMRLKKELIFVASGIMVLFFGCSDVGNLIKPDITPTKTQMEGVWKVTQAYDASDSSILSKISMPFAAFHLSSDNTVISTGGPMVTYIVYGPNKWTEISAQIDQIFNYASLSFNGGEFFIGDSVQQRFTLEMKLEGVGGTKTLTDILQLFNIDAQWLKTVVYHKFIGVKVGFNSDATVMTWELDNATTAVYNTKDSNGNYILWQGWPTNSFTRCRFILTKQSKDLADLIKDTTTTP